MKNPAVSISLLALYWIPLNVNLKNITLKTSISGDFPKFFQGDITRLKQVLINLLSNAVKFTKEGEVLLEVISKKKAPNKFELKFSVKDSGIGIPHEKQELIFGEFSQSDSSTTRKFGGTGLGLSISQKLVSLMDSKLLLESREGKGSIFYFSLSVEEAFPNQNVAPSLDNQNDLSFLQGHCLVVEDNQVNIKVLTKRLEILGLTYKVAQNGEAAIDQVNGESFDLVFMDIQMPVMDGLTATKLIREQGHQIPIIAMTANVQDSDQRACKEAGMNFFIGKPIKKEKLIATIKDILIYNKSA